MEDNSSIKRAFWSLIAMRIVYAINWLNIGSIFEQIALEFNTGISSLGSLTSSFYVGIGITQIPGGIFAAKFGAKKAVILGNFVSSLAALLSSFSDNIEEMILLRFFVGAGMGMVFSPGVSILASYFQKEKKGYSVGLYNSAYDVGGVLALFLWGIIAASFGWRQSLVLSGLLGLITTLFAQILVKADKNENQKISLSEVKKILLDRDMFFLSLGVLSVGTGNAVIGSFIVYYLELKYGFSEALAGLIGALVVFVPIFSSVLAGKLYDMTRNTKLLMFLSAVLTSLSELMVPYVQGIFSGFATFIAGIGVGIGITVGFAAARDLSKASANYEPLAIAWVNFISLFGAFFPPLVFSQIASNYGYHDAWLFGSIVTMVLGLLVLKIKD